MRPLYKEEDLENAKSIDKLPCECYNCNCVFYTTKEIIKEALNPNSKTKNKFCSKKCFNESRSTKVRYNCHNCGKECLKKKSQIKLSKSGFNFCSRSCTTIHHLKNKTYGNNRSKLEIFIEEKLKSRYNNINFIFNFKNQIGYELDIFIPNLNLAFELNGIFHYAPIFGEEKLKKVKYKDEVKKKMCLESDIDLYQIDTTEQDNFNESSSTKYLYFIIDKIEEKLNQSQLNFLYKFDS